MTTELVDLRAPITTDGFRWQCMDGRILRLEQMETKHIFHSMKMCFNHLAEARGGEPVEFTRKYRDYRRHAKENSDGLARLVVFFLAEIEKRGDLPSWHRPAYDAIVSQIRQPRYELAASGGLIDAD